MFRNAHNVLLRIIAYNGYNSCRNFHFPKLGQYAKMLTIQPIHAHFTLFRLVSKSMQLLNCWKCHNKNDVSFILFCPSCHVIQKPSNQNFFELFSLEECYNLDEQNLPKKFKDMQKLLHPDKFTLASQEEQEIAAEYSALVNRAYSTLRNPWLRGTYLLKLRGIDFDEATTVDDPDFLMSVMEINEIIADTESLPVLRDIQKVNLTELQSAIELISLAFEADHLESAKKHLITVRYLTNIREKVSEKLYSLGERSL